MTDIIEKAEVSVGTENGHRHSFDPAVNKGTTSEDHGHTHAYNLDKGVTEFTNAHRHSIPNVLKEEWKGQIIKGEVFNKEQVAAVVKGIQDIVDASEAVRKENEKVFAKASKPVCKFCDSPATKSVIRTEGKAFIKTCDKHLQKAKDLVNEAEDDKVVKVVEIEIEIGPKDEDEDMEKAQPTIGAVHAPSTSGSKKPKDDEDKFNKQEKVMPYATNADLPENVRGVLPAAAQSIFRNVFNSAVEGDATEDSARKQAWGALKNQGWEKQEDKWVKVKKSEESFDYMFDQKNSAILKQDEEQQLITGVVMEPDTVDTQGDVVSKEEIQKAAYKFLVKSRTIGLQHKKKGPVDVVESFIVPEDMTMGGQEVKKGSWLMTVKVTDDKVWQNVKDGKYTGFSIGGYAAKS